MGHSKWNDNISYDEDFPLIVKLGLASVFKRLSNFISIRFLS